MNSKVLKSKNDSTMFSTKCAVCNSKKSGHMKEQETEPLLTGLGLKTPLSKIKMNQIVNEFLLT